MKAEELRIGNLVTIDNPKCYAEIKGIPMKVVSINKEYATLQSLTRYRDEYSQFFEYIKPIPITWQTLSNCGLVTTFKNTAGVIYGFVKDNEIISPHVSLKYGEPIKFMKREIYLHDLQNICFVLTGEEINITNLFNQQ